MRRKKQNTTQEAATHQAEDQEDTEHPGIGEENTPGGRIISRLWRKEQGMRKTPAATEPIQKINRLTSEQLYRSRRKKPKRNQYIGEEQAGQEEKPTEANQEQNRHEEEKLNALAQLTHNDPDTLAQEIENIMSHEGMISLETAETIRERKTKNY